MRHPACFHVFWAAMLLAWDAAPSSMAQTTTLFPPPTATSAADAALRRLPPVTPSASEKDPQVFHPSNEPASLPSPAIISPSSDAADLPALGTVPTSPDVPSAAGGELVEPGTSDPADSDVELADSETQPVYSWHNIHYWFPPEIWEASIELGVNGSEGNSNTLNTQVGANAKRTTDVQILELDLTYTNNTSNSIETANQGLFTSRYDWLVPESSASLFINSSLEFDRFRAFDLRWALNLGVGFSVIRNERTTLAGRFGSGVSQEVGGPDEQYVPEATFGIEFSHQINKQQKVAIKVDYFPDWQDYGSFRVNTDAGWEILLSEPMNLSLKLAILDRYDSTPNGAELNDLNYSLLLLWKL